MGFDEEVVSVQVLLELITGLATFPEVDDPFSPFVDILSKVRPQSALTTIELLGGGYKAAGEEGVEGVDVFLHSSGGHLSVLSKGVVDQMGREGS